VGALGDLLAAAHPQVTPDYDDLFDQAFAGCFIHAPYRTDNDLARVHRCGVLAAEVGAGQNKYRDIEDAAVRLRDMMERRATDRSGGYAVQQEDHDRARAGRRGRST
jgi:hypothetical protein